MISSDLSIGYYIERGEQVVVYLFARRKPRMAAEKVEQARAQLCWGRHPIMIHMVCGLPEMLILGESRLNIIP